MSASVRIDMRPHRLSRDVCRSDEDVVAVPVAYNAIHVVPAHWVAQHPTIERSCRHLVGNPCAQSKKNRCGTVSSSLNLHPTRHGRNKKEGVL